MTGGPRSIDGKSKAPWGMAAVVMVCGLAAYLNSFSGPFVYDDILSINLNPRLRSLTPDVRPTASPNSLSGRPVSEWTFQIDYWMGELNVGVYHATNLGIHLGCALLLLGIVRRTLKGMAGFEGWEAGIARAAAAIWAVHPLNTAAVTYVIQRTESLMAFFYLGVIYCLIRFAGEKKTGWAVAGVAACCLGMGAKETMVTAPVVALAFDRTFLSGSFGAALRARWKFYLGLAASWVILGLLHQLNGRGASAGFGMGMGAMDYARTQLDVMSHYLRLAIWPTGLVFDAFDWPVDQRWDQMTAGGWLVLILILASVWMFWVRPAAGFLGCWVFVILSPTSSFVPIVSEIMAEQRMYLPLMGIVVLVVAGGWRLARRLRAEKAFPVVAAVVVVALAWGTWARNVDYQSEEGLWRDAIAKRPGNARAHMWLGSVFLRTDRPTLAVGEYVEALRLKPDYHEVVHPLADALMSGGDTTAAEKFCAEQISGNTPVAVDARFLRANIRMLRQDFAGAKEDLEVVVASDVKAVAPHYWLGIALENLGETKEAIQELQKAAAIDPSYHRVLLELMVMEGVKGTPPQALGGALDRGGSGR